ncbi:MAG TPA: four helix bundle protein [Puia sp.]
MRDGSIVKKSIYFSVLILSYSDLLNNKRQVVISTQLLKSGTSIGANVFEAQYSESRLDFIHKMKVALKEANEKLYWLTLCKKMDDLEVQQEMFNSLHEIMSILSKIIITSKKNLNSNSNKV